MRPAHATRHRRLVALATASLVLTACGRDDAGGEAEDQSEAISGGEATGTIDVWAMGTEGEVLQDFSADVRGGQPRRHRRGHRHPVGVGPRQDRRRDRQRRDARREPDRHHLDG